MFFAAGGWSARGETSGLPDLESAFAPSGTGTLVYPEARRACALVRSSMPLSPSSESFGRDPLFRLVALDSPMTRHSPARQLCAGSIITSHSSLATGFLIYRAAIRNPSNVLKT
jgi:hypothetical protein